ncbi:Protein of unknown function [Thalassobacillus cyri]|uniref:DUF1653 domain-containing protein n=1 Tax=Thalassobacillus cyri TaxID=571932 RepID=A0A1H4H4F3_9BACI|nr:DUF1653 domain-containing protein [Thalassobacillus cyri]SEB15912.1 Protein of unknown function [Thalassobacillus cyri]
MEGRIIVKRGEFYKHFKGNTYQVMGLALDSESKEVMVIYKSFKDEITWVRPYSEFTDVHPEHNVKRFKKVEVTE